MQSSDIPVKFPIPFADAAGGSFIRPIPVASQIGIQDGAASLTDGFPPLTMTPSGSGGVFPFGQDMNGILEQISAWTRWMNAGGAVPYDATFQAAAGGYPLGAVIASATTQGLYYLCTTENNVTNPDAGGAGWISHSILPVIADLSVNGYAITPCARPDGTQTHMIEQWGTYATPVVGENLIVITFPIIFPNACIHADATGYNPTGTILNDMWPEVVSTTQTTLTVLINGVSGSLNLGGFTWRANGS